MPDETAPNSLERDADRLTDHVAVIVGASAGIGAETARELASRGTNVVVAARRREALEEVAGSADGLGGGTVEPFVADTTNPDDLKALVRFAVERFGRLDYAVNNAGVSGRGSILELKKEFVENVLSVNLAGMFWALQAELPEIEKNGGAIVNTASVGGLVGVPGLSAYAASKRGVIGLTKSVALEYATRGVRINAVAPGSTATEMLMSGSQESRDFHQSRADEAAQRTDRDRSRDRVPARRRHVHNRHRPRRGRRPVRAMTTPQNTPRCRESRKPLAERTALITGAPRSIGRAITEALAQDGANIVAHYHSREEEATELAEVLERRGTEVLSVQADLTDPGAVGHLFDAATERFGAIDVVIANAGRPGNNKPVAEISDEEYDGLQAVNARAVFMVLREAAARVRDEGRIINISSTTTAYQAGYAMYGASKAGANVIVRILAAELGARGITSNSLIVGPIAAGFLAGDSAFDAGSDVLDQLAAASPAGRPGTPDDVAAVAAFLAQPEAGWINGQLLTINGGATV